MKNKTLYLIDHAFYNCHYKSAFLIHADDEFEKVEYRIAAINDIANDNSAYGEDPLLTAPLIEILEKAYGYKEIPKESVPYDDIWKAINEWDDYNWNCDFGEDEIEYLNYQFQKDDILYTVQYIDIFETNETHEWEIVKKYFTTELRDIVWKTQDKYRQLLVKLCCEEKETLEKYFTKSEEIPIWIKNVHPEMIEEAWAQHDTPRFVKARHEIESSKHWNIYKGRIAEMRDSISAGGNKIVINKAYPNPDDLYTILVLDDKKRVYYAINIGVEDAALFYYVIDYANKNNIKIEVNHGYFN